MGVFGANYGANYNLLADTTDPTVSIVSPIDTATVNSNFTASGTAADNIGLSKVEVQIDSDAFQLATGTTNWTINLTGVTDGPHTLTAKATDTSANTGTDTINITVTGGVQIEGTHARPLIGSIGGRPKPKIRRIELAVTARVSKAPNMFTASARILRDVRPAQATSKITKTTERSITSKITRLRHSVAEAMTFSKDPARVKQYEQSRNIDQFLKESKAAKLKKIYGLYRDLDDI